jgi:hypothetical protein
VAEQESIANPGADQSFREGCNAGTDSAPLAGTRRGSMTFAVRRV